MVTLAHHIRNANVVIGGFISRMIKNLPDPEVQRQLQLIQQASRENTCNFVAPLMATGEN